MPVSNGLDTSGKLDSSLTRPKLDTTLIFDGSPCGEEEEVTKSKCPLFALVSLNQHTAPSAEIPWSQLLALSLTPEADPPSSLLSVGRHKDCNVQLADPRVSLRHFEIMVRRRRLRAGETDTLEYECVLHDRSSNGTLVNGQTVGKGNQQQLRSGDEIVVLPANRVGSDHSVSFVFRNTTESLDIPREVRSLDLDELVLCPICMQCIHKCVALMPCFHNFCMACYSEWMARKDDCPLCRRPVTCVMKNHPMEAIVEAFLEAFPERRRTPEELEEMDKKDRLKLGYGGKIVREFCTVAPPSAASFGMTPSASATAAAAAALAAAAASLPSSVHAAGRERASNTTTASTTGAGGTSRGGSNNTNEGTGATAAASSGPGGNSAAEGGTTSRPPPPPTPPRPGPPATARNGSQVCAVM